MAGAFTDPKFFGYLGGLNPNQHITEGHNSYRRITGATDQKVTLQNKKGKAAKQVKIDRLKKAGAKAAIAAGGDIGAKVAKERPVLAARMGTYANESERLEAIAKARQDPNARHNERKARRSKVSRWSVG